MPDASSTVPQRVAVLGAAGRVGRALTSALLQRGAHVDAVLRDPGRRALPPHARLRVIQGDARHAGELAAHLRAVDALALSVTPFTAPPASFDGFDLDYYASIVAGIDAHWRGSHRRLVAVGLTATLRLDTGGTVMDDQTLFPAELRPFAEAHARQLPALAGTTLDWALLTPPAGLGAADAEGYQLVAEPLTQPQATAQLTHALYARAFAAELLQPTVHAARVAVLPC